MGRRSRTDRSSRPRLVEMCSRRGCRSWGECSGRSGSFCREEILDWDCSVTAGWFWRYHGIDDDDDCWSCDIIDDDSASSSVGFKNADEGMSEVIFVLLVA
jgi:hypothetical protein